MALPVLQALQGTASTTGATTARRCSGLRGLVFKSHGSADAFAFEQALSRAYDAARNRLLDRVHDRILETLAALPVADDARGAAAASRMNATLPRHSRITGTGSYLPPRRVTNEELARDLAARGIETSDSWIVERTGIRARHFADDGVTSSDLAVARRAPCAGGRRASTRATSTSSSSRPPRPT